MHEGSVRVRGGVRLCGEQRTFAKEVLIARVERPALRLHITKDPRVARLLRMLPRVLRARLAALGGTLFAVPTPIDDGHALRIRVRLLATLWWRRDAGAVGKAIVDGLGKFALAIAADEWRRWRRCCCGGGGGERCSSGRWRRWKGGGSGKVGGVRRLRELALWRRYGGNKWS